MSGIGGDERATLHHLLGAIDAGDAAAAREWLVVLLVALGRVRTAEIVIESEPAPFPRVPT